MILPATSWIWPSWRKESPPDTTGGSPRAGARSRGAPAPPVRRAGSALGAEGPGAGELQGGWQVDGQGAVSLRGRRRGEGDGRGGGGNQGRRGVVGRRGNGDRVVRRVRPVARG